MFDNLKINFGHVTTMQAATGISGKPDGSGHASMASNKLIKFKKIYKF